MANETLARLSQTPPDSVAENDYRSFCAALGASARGRAFLSEYARRNRHADTEVVLQALARLEKTARGGQGSAAEAERIRQDLRALLDTLRTARPQVDNTPGAIKAATLAALIDFVQARIEALVTPARAGLSQVPELEQPELPIPQPSALMPAAIALLRPDADAQSLAAAAERHDKASPADIVSDVKFIDIALVKPQPLDLSTAAETPMAIDTSMPAPHPAAAAAEAAASNTTTVAIEAYELWLDQLKVMQGDIDIEVSAELHADVQIETQAEPQAEARADMQAAAQQQAAAQKNAQPKKPADSHADLITRANLLLPVVTPELAEPPQAPVPEAGAPAPVQSEVAFKWPTLPEPQAAAPADAQSEVAFKWPAASQAAAPRAAAQAAPKALAPGDPGFKWPEPAKPSALSPRQAAIVALAAEAEAKAKGQAVGQAVIAALAAEAEAKAKAQIIEPGEAPVVTPAAAPVAEQPTAPSGPLSPRQAAIAALAAQNKAQQPAAPAPQQPVVNEAPVVTQTAAPIAEQPVTQSGPLSPRQAAIAALAAQNKLQQPAAAAPQQPIVNQAPQAPVVTQTVAPVVEQAAAPSDPLAALAAQVEAQQSVTSHIPESDLTPPPASQAEPIKPDNKPAVKSAADPLDAIMTLTDDERIALFT